MSGADEDLKYNFWYIDQFIVNGMIKCVVLDGKTYALHNRKENLIILYVIYKFNLWRNYSFYYILLYVTNIYK